MGATGTEMAQQSERRYHNQQTIESDMAQPGREADRGRAASPINYRPTQSDGRQQQTNNSEGTVRAPGKGIQRRVMQRDSLGYREHLPEQYQGHSPVQETGNGTVAVGIIKHRFSTSAKRRADWR